jgi:hypothetical protein
VARRRAETGSKWKTIPHKDQLDMFAGVIRARLADIGALGTVSITLNPAITLVVWGSLLTTADDFWLRPTLTKLFWPLLVCFLLSLMTVVVWSLKLIERMDVFAVAHLLAISGTAIVLPWGFLQINAIEQDRAQERAMVARAKAEETERKAVEARARAEEAERIAAQARADAVRAEEECLRQRDEAKKRAARRRTDAHGSLQQCKDEFEKSKWIFTQDTAERRCAAHLAEVEAAERAVRVAANRSCIRTSP